jgi:hypothetical protein
VILTVTGSSRSTNRSSDVLNFGVFVLKMLQGSAETGLEETPASRILLFLLAPNYFSVRVGFKGGHEGVEREGSKLLETEHSHVLGSKLLTLGNQVIVDLARAEDDLSAGGGIDIRVGLSNNSGEVRLTTEVLDVRTDFTHLEHLLRSNNNKRLAERTEHLSAEDMEVLGSSCAVNNLDVALFVQILLGLSNRGVVRVTELQETLNTAGGMLGTITVETMR